MDYEMATQTPSAMLEPQCPSKQLEFELGKNASIALQARAKKAEEEDKEILEFLNILDKKLSSMKKKKPPQGLLFWQGPPNLCAQLLHPTWCQCK